MGTQLEPKTEKPRGDERAFAETALRLGGKSEQEAKTLGAVDRADDQVEAMFAARYQTTASPIHRAIWDKSFPLELFAATPAPANENLSQRMTDALGLVRRHKQNKTLYDGRGKIAENVLKELNRTGYWGLLVDPKYGGLGVPMAQFGAFLTRMATIDATVAGLASVHGCIGAVDPIRTFGTAEQKQKFLPGLASGERLSGFALTEPGAGSDLTALRTRAVLQGDQYLVTGEKLFITNAIPGRTLALVVLINDKPAVLIADLPPSENEQFRLQSYGLWALKRTNNHGLFFKDFPVPKENLLQPTRGDGLTIAYHGLNLGRVAVCAGAAGNMRVMLASMVDWAKFRRTYGEPIGTRELVRRRIGRLAGLIVAADALVAWCGALLDQGYRGEMECTIAKIFGAEAQKEAAVELFMKTHGGRSFLHGHLFGDEVNEFLAPCIYEGEGEMLGMAFFKSLIKEHGKKYFEPVGKALVAAGIRQPNLANPLHAWKLRGALTPYAKWWMRERISGWRRPPVPAMPQRLSRHVEFAVDELQASRLEISAVLRKHQLKLADRQCRMAEVSQRVQDLVLMIVTALHAAALKDEITTLAADVVCQDLARRYTGRRPSDGYFRDVNELGRKIVDGGFKPLTGIDVAEILMPYQE